MGNMKRNAVGDPSEALPNKGSRRKRDRAAEKRRRAERKEKPAKPGMPGSVNDSRRCSATAHRTGERCKAPAMIGSTTCRVHGSAAPQVRKAAKERLLELADPAIAALSKIVRDENTDDAVRLRAALGVLDRIGYGPGTKVELGVSKFEEAITEVVVDRENLALELGVGDLPSGPTPLDVMQHLSDAQADADRERDWDEAPSRILPDGHVVVSGEVVDNNPPQYGRG